MDLDIREFEEVCRDLYVRALKILPPDIKAGFADLQRTETGATGRAILDTMVENVAVAERTNNILCQDTGIPIYNVVIGADVRFDGAALKAAIRRGCARATTEFSAALLGGPSDHAARTSRPPAASGCRSSMSTSTTGPRRWRSR